VFVSISHCSLVLAYHTVLTEIDSVFQRVWRPALDSRIRHVIYADTKNQQESRN